MSDKSIHRLWARSKPAFYLAVGRSAAEVMRCTGRERGASHTQSERLWNGSSVRKPEQRPCGLQATRISDGHLTDDWQEVPARPNVTLRSESTAWSEGLTFNRPEHPRTCSVSLCDRFKKNQEKQESDFLLSHNNSQNRDWAQQLAAAALSETCKCKVLKYETGSWCSAKASPDK